MTFDRIDTAFGPVSRARSQEHTMTTFDVFGMCNPLYDIQAAVPEELLSDLELAKGGMMLVDEEQQKKIVPVIYAHIVLTAAGGSGANTMTGIAQLGGKACYAGRIGNDEHATLYEEGLTGKGVHSSLGRGEGTTGICLVLVTPDTQRTMCTFLGCSRELSRKDIRVDLLKASRYLYVTAYLWDTPGQKDAVEFAMSTAKASGVKVSVSLSDPFCVNRHKGELLDLVRKNVDVIIGNRAEAQALTDTGSAEDAARVLAENCDVAVVTMDSSGSLICAGDTITRIPAVPATPVDTTGAGDMYAAGFLYGLTQGFGLDKSGNIASFVASKTVSQFGPRLESVDLQSALDSAASRFPYLCE